MTTCPGEGVLEAKLVSTIKKRAHLVDGGGIIDGHMPVSPKVFQEAPRMNAVAGGWRSSRDPG